MNANSDYDELCRLMGLMVVQAGYLECAIGELAADLTGEDREGPVLANPASRNIAICKAEAIRQEIPERSRAICMTLDACTPAFERRHQYVHGLWVWTVGGTLPPPKHTWRVRRNGDVLEKLITPEDLRDLGETMSRLCDDVYEWMGEN
ncbi:hypothetical protein [Streptomyces pseudovenezuelae]|uniref:hypothetical protein n=1 Tax=Streptomyces pseudovenezuelae TaxID=67350 RepID=UPI0036E0DF60